MAKKIKEDKRRFSKILERKQASKRREDGKPVRKQGGTVAESTAKPRGAPTPGVRKSHTLHRGMPERKTDVKRGELSNNQRNQPKGKIQDDPRFRKLDRQKQRQIEKSGDPWKALGGGGGGGGKNKNSISEGGKLSDKMPGGKSFSTSPTQMTAQSRTARTTKKAQLGEGMQAAPENFQPNTPQPAKSPQGPGIPQEEPGVPGAGPGETLQGGPPGGPVIGEEGSNTAHLEAKEQGVPKVNSVAEATGTPEGMEGGPDPFERLGNQATQNVAQNTPFAEDQPPGERRANIAAEMERLDTANQNAMLQKKQIQPQVVQMERMPAPNEMGSITEGMTIQTPYGDMKRENGQLRVSYSPYMKERLKRAEKRDRKKLSKFTLSDTDPHAPKFPIPNPGTIAFDPFSAEGWINNENSVLDKYSKG